MEAALKAALKTTKLKATGATGSGCISSGESYDTDVGRVFIKQNSKPMAKQMFEGEYASLEAILATGTIRVPKPLAVVENPSGGAALVMEHVSMRSSTKYSSELGERLANLHLDNKRKQQKAQDNSVSSSEDDFVDKFGFHVTTCCGYLPMENEWHADWPEFFCRQRIVPQIRMAEQKYGDREAGKLWAELERHVPGLFRGLDHICPALLHGDLWNGNAAETAEGPVVFDPASFYGHAEFDLSIAKLFGGFGDSFYSAYFRHIPKAPGFERRLLFYQLFHYLNHWNHFGGGYRGSSLATMKKLLK